MAVSGSAVDNCFVKRLLSKESATFICTFSGLAALFCCLKFKELLLFKTSKVCLVLLYPPVPVSEVVVGVNFLCCCLCLCVHTGMCTTTVYLLFITC